MRLQIAADWRKLLLSALLCTSALAKKDKPSVTSQKFDFLPQRVQYFDDSDVILFEDWAEHVIWRSDDAGEKWDKVSEPPAGKVRGVTMHPFDKKRAYIITSEKTHWKTKDRGKHWEKFSSEYLASGFQLPLSFHAGDPDRIIFNGMDCTGPFCEEVSLFTTDDFSTDAKFLRAATLGCHWAKASELFTTGQTDLDADRILCRVKGRFSAWSRDYRLLVSDNYFKDGQEFEPELELGRTVQGIVNMVVVKKFLIVAATSDKTDEMALYVSDNTVKWHRAVFPHDHKLQESAYTVLEGTNYSIQIDAMNSRASNPMGVLLSSNSNGTYFTRNIEHTNRNSEDYVDFEKVTGIQGIFLVNTVKNFKEAEESGEKKKVVTKITFDDGRTFQSVKCDEDDLHLQSVTHLTNSGRVFSSPAPGIVMGVGNTGDHLKDYNDGNLYVSNDAGVTWRLGLKGPYKYEFGDSGSILVAIKDNGEPVDELKYSLNHGKDWGEVDLKQKIQPKQLTTTQDSTSLKFLLEGTGGSEGAQFGYIIAIDFDDMHERKCKDNDEDMENWSARVDKDGNPTCLMGHTQTYRRRKTDADCFVKNEFVDPEPTSVPCDCSNDDFECDFNFVRSEDHKECVPAGPLIIPDGDCDGFGPETTFQASSGWRQIPGNDCKRKDGEKYKDAPVDRKCADSVKPPSSGKVTHQQHPFLHKIISKEYLERTGISTGNDETVIVRTQRNVFLSHDHGKTWKEIKKLGDEEIISMIPHPYFNDVIYFVTTSKKVFYSIDRGENIRSFKAPHPPTKDARTPIMSFHSKFKDWIIWHGAKDCSNREGCHNVASLTQDRGDNKWQTLQRYVEKCEFIREPETRLMDQDSRERRERLIFCTASKNEDSKPDNTKQLVSSSDFFASRSEHFENVVDFATMSEFIVVARHDKEHVLKAAASVDGQTFADARFPHGFVVNQELGYTVLDSSTHAIFLHVTVDDTEGNEYGSIIKSNSNGTSYTLALNGVDRDRQGYVDFEKMFGIEGLAMVNVVTNYESKDFGREKKRLKSMITHNDGAEWNYLSPPGKDADGKKFSCSGGLDKCSLNIHGYTDRSDKSHTFYSNSAIGLMVGVGNVGEHLTEYDDSDTFMTADAGITWKPTRKGIYMWEFGDQGSIVVLVKEKKPTKVIHYSLDEGDNWIDYEFSDHEVEIHDITTVPSDNSRNFLLWGQENGNAFTVNVDFTGLTDVQCKLDENDVLAGDYDLWTPRHPNQDDDCLFGHVSQYHRKKTASDCYNGRMIPRLHDIARNCSCTRRDYECDYNFERQIDGSCKLVPGLPEPDHSAQCAADPDQTQWFEVTGYRKLVTSTCTGGKEFDQSISHPCHDHEEEFNRKHGVSGAAIFFSITIPMVVAAGVGYWVWRNWATKIGQIRLGDQSATDGEPIWIKFPVILISGLVALAQALPLLGGSLWRSATSAFGRGGSRTFRTRGSFARGRGDYAIVDEDEGELLGDESDEEV